MTYVHKYGYHELLAIAGRVVAGLIVLGFAIIFRVLGWF